MRAEVRQKEEGTVSFLIPYPASRLPQRTPNAGLESPCGTLIGHCHSVSRLLCLTDATRPGFGDDGIGIDLGGSPSSELGQGCPRGKADSTELSGALDDAVRGKHTSSALVTAGRDATVRMWDVTDGSRPTLQRLFIGHSHWINDIAKVTTPAGVILATCSNDRTVCVWRSCHVTPRDGGYLPRPEIVKPAATLSHHTDYVYCVTIAEMSAPCLMATSSADGQIILSDLERTSRVAAIHRDPSLVVANSPVLLGGNDQRCLRHQQVVSLRLTQNGSLLSYASRNDCYVWDTRIARPARRTGGHSDFVRQFRLTDDGKHGISTCSDGSVCLWDFRAASDRPHTELVFHTDSVWALWANPDSHDTFFTGDRRGGIRGFRAASNESEQCFWMADTSTEKGVFRQQDMWMAAGVLDLEFDVNTRRLYASTGDSSVLFYDLQKEFCEGWFSGAVAGSPTKGEAKAFDIQATPAGRSTVQKLASVEGLIPGFPRVRRYAVLRDQRTVITEALTQDVDSWDIVEGTHLECHGKVEFDELVASKQPFVSRPQWFAVDVILGCLRVTLTRPTVFDSEVLEIPGKLESSVTLGCRTLDRLFGRLKNSASNVHEACTFLTIQLVSTDGPHDSGLIVELTCSLTPKEVFRLPTWVTDWLFERKMAPIQEKNITVYFLPSTRTELPALPRNPFICKRLTPMSWVSLHISDTLGSSSSPSTRHLGNSGSVHGAQLRLSCCGVTLEPTWDMGTVKDLVWRKEQPRRNARPFEILYDYGEELKKTGTSAPSRVGRLFSRPAASLTTC